MALAMHTGLCLFRTDEWAALELAQATRGSSQSSAGIRDTDNHKCEMILF